MLVLLQSLGVVDVLIATDVAARGNMVKRRGRGGDE